MQVDYTPTQFMLCYESGQKVSKLHVTTDDAGGPSFCVLIVLDNE